MDDFNAYSLTESRNEYCALFVNKLTPLLIQGIQSIFDEAYKLCIENDEDEKYLMTFQNFLGRITKWNQDLVNTETERIVKESGCSYLEDLLTCVHITQLKILTSVRVGQKQKKIDINVPKLQDFVHKSYIEVARKIYKNVFLFETDIMPLDKQRQMRELEIIVKESIINVIRNNMPVEDILRAYVDETVEENVYEINETVTDVVADVSSAEVLNQSAENDSTDDTQAGGAVNNSTTQTNDVETKEHTGIIVKKSSMIAQEDDVAALQSSETDNKQTPIVIPTPTIDDTPVPVLTPKLVSPNLPTTMPTSPSALAFNAIDHVKTYNDTDIPTTIQHTTENKLNAPKTIERLEQISEMRNEQRKQEEDDDDDEDSIKIHSDTPINLGALDVHDLSNPIQLHTTPLLGEVTTLT